MSITERDLTDIISAKLRDAEPIQPTANLVQSVNEPCSDLIRSNTEPLAESSTQLPLAESPKQSSAESLPRPSSNANSNTEPHDYPINEEIPHDSIASFLRKHEDLPIFDKIAGLIYGCALGDCLGVQVEMQTPDEIKRNYPNGIQGLSRNDYKNIQSGDWSDDTDQMILLVEMLAEHKLNFNIRTFTKKLSDWVRKGFQELGDVTGISVEPLTSRVVSKDTFLTNPLEASLSASREIKTDYPANGSLMRTGILSISNNWQTTVIYTSSITHVDTRAIYSCWLLTSICRELLLDQIPDLIELFKTRVSFIKAPEKVADFNAFKRMYTLDKISSKPYTEENLSQLLKQLNLSDDRPKHVFKCLGCAIYAVKKIEMQQVHHAADFKQIQLDIVNEGGDTDTNAAVSGQVLGAYLGYRNLPMDWIKQLRHKDWLDRRIIALLNAMLKKFA